MPALDAALALAQVDYFAVLIPKHLKLNMPRTFDESFRVNVRRAKCLLRFAPRGFIRGKQFFLLAYDAHPAAAPSCRSLQDQRVADPGGLFRELFFAFHYAVAARNRGESRRSHFPSRAVLRSHHFDHFGGGPDEGDFGGLADLGKIGILRQKAVTRMNRVHIGDLCRADYLWNVQIAFAAAGRADADSFVGKPHVEGVTVRFGINSYGRDAQLFAGANDPQGDL